MIDWHSHVLPGVDDGSRNVEESLTMLDALWAQGVDLVMATPHFYANLTTVDDFLAKRNAAYESLAPHLGEERPQVMCGAEVRYYSGISQMQDLERLTLGDTNLLLLEMPMNRWTEYTIQELLTLASTRRLKIVMAHIERYLSYQGKGVFERLIENGFLMQVNASFFGGLGSRHKALKMLSSGKIHMIGSDCHNMTTRPPQIERAYELIEKKFGEHFVFQMTDFGYAVIGHSKK